MALTSKKPTCSACYATARRISGGWLYTPCSKHEARDRTLPGPRPGPKGNPNIREYAEELKSEGIPAATIRWHLKQQFGNTPEVRQIARELLGQEPETGLADLGRDRGVADEERGRLRANPDDELRRLEREAAARPGDKQAQKRLQRARQRAGLPSGAWRGAMRLRRRGKAITFERVERIELDVWGNEEDGFEVNNAMRTGRTVLIPAAANHDNDIIEALIQHGELTERARGRVNLDDDGYTITIEDNHTGEPLVQFQRVPRRRRNPDDERVRRLEQKVERGQVLTREELARLVAHYRRHGELHRHIDERETIDPEAVKHLFANAPYVVGERIQGAIALAWAQAKMDELGWEVHFDIDESATQREIEENNGEPFYRATLYINSRPEATLGMLDGIPDGSQEWRQYVAASLALEALMSCTCSTQDEPTCPVHGDR
jgi:hypothetical protein